MLLALLYTGNDHIAAAALACDQLPYGDRYWHEVHERPVPADRSQETAYIDIADPALCAQLLRMTNDTGFRDGFEAAAAVEQYRVEKNRVEQGRAETANRRAAA